MGITYYYTRENGTKSDRGEENIIIRISFTAATRSAANQYWVYIEIDRP